MTHRDGNESNQRRLFPLTSGGYLLSLPPGSTPVPEVDALIERLAGVVIGETVNQYADSCSGGVERRERLSRYLSARWSMATTVLVGEAAGYRGCRLSGIPFTSMRQLGLGSTSEASATIVHRTLAGLDAEERVILWNIVPTHPCRGDAPLTSNRAPTRAEVAAGAELLPAVATGRSVIAVGRVAQRVLGGVWAGADGTAGSGGGYVMTPTPTAVLLATSISKADLQSAIIELAHTSGWLVHHTRPARTRKGWRTPIQGDAGLPDLVLARNGCVLFAELKSQRGQVSPEQQSWIRALDGERVGPLLPGQDRVLRPVSDGGWVSVVVWRPSDWLSGEIAEQLGGTNERAN